MLANLNVTGAMAVAILDPMQANLNVTRANGVEILNWLNTYSHLADGLVFTGRNGSFLAGAMAGIPLPYCLLDTARIWRGDLVGDDLLKKFNDEISLLKYSEPVGSLIMMLDPQSKADILQWRLDGYESPRPDLPMKKLILVDDHLPCYPTSTANIINAALKCWNQQCVGFLTSSVEFPDAEYNTALDYHLQSIYVFVSEDVFISEVEGHLDNGVPLSKMTRELYEDCLT